MDFAEPTWIQVLELTFINLVTWARPRTLPCGRGCGELPFPPAAPDWCAGVALWRMCLIFDRLWSAGLEVSFLSPSSLPTKFK